VGVERCLASLARAGERRVGRGADASRSGPGDVLLLASDEIPPTGGGLNGRLSRLVISRRVLSEKEIGKLAASE